jgi:predicted RNA-binding Zn-ribbon protein involved in translation (DUF1610 family)
LQEPDPRRAKNWATALFFGSFALGLLVVPAMSSSALDQKTWCLGAFVVQILICTTTGAVSLVLGLAIGSSTRARVSPVLIAFGAWTGVLIFGYGYILPVVFVARFIGRLLRPQRQDQNRITWGEKLQRWLLPELALFATRAEANAAFRAGTREALQRAGVPIGTIVVSLVTGYVWYRASQSSLTFWPRLALNSAAGAMMALTAGLSLLRVRPHVRRLLRQQLVERAVQVCLSCGYDLTGNMSGACPECGTSCGLNRRRRPHQRTWLDR